MNEPAQPHQPISIVIQLRVDDNIRSRVDGDDRSGFVMMIFDSIVKIDRRSHSIGYWWGGRVRSRFIEFNHNY
jgi:hypothetical protein